MVGVLDTLAPLAFIIVVAVIVYLAIKSKHQERMALIEKGVDITVFCEKKGNSKVHLRNGILLIALAAGFLAGSIIDDKIQIERIIAYAMGLLLCEGLGFLVYYNMIKNKTL